MHRLQPVAGIGQRAAHDGGQRIGEVALFQRITEVDDSPAGPRGGGGSTVFTMRAGYRSGAAAASSCFVLRPATPHEKLTVLPIGTSARG